MVRFDVGTTNPDRFPKAVVETVAKRAGNICSNPDCQALTSGPAEKPTASINVGEAAHIFGARPGSARYRAEMVPAERSDTTNAIWLCRNCHKLIDADQLGYPHELLFEWRRAHDEAISAKVGKAGAALRHRAEERLLEDFRNETYLAQQIVLDRPYAWEYKLTAELLRSKTDATLARWRALQKGLYVRPLGRLAEDEVMDWCGDRLHELGLISPALSRLVNGEVQAAWGAPGEPGSPIDILRMCELFAENCTALLAWEEKVRFARVPEAFEAIHALLAGVGGHLLSKISEIPQEMTRIFSEPHPEGVFVVSVVIDTPEGWTEQFEAAMADLRDAYAFD